MNMAFVNRLSLWLVAALIGMAAVGAHATPAEEIDTAYRRRDVQALQPWAEQGVAMAQYLLGKLLFDKGKTEAAQWTRRAAEQGMPEAQHALGGLYQLGYGYVVPRNSVTALEWSRKAAEQGYAPAQVSVARSLEDSSRVKPYPAEAIAWWKKAANGGDIGAQKTLGERYARGEGVPRNYSEAAKWLRFAADLGDLNSQLIVGAFYQNGTGVAKDDIEAVWRYTKVIERDNSEISLALVWLGDLFLTGVGIRHDDSKALAFYKAAAARQDPSGLSRLGSMYAEGRGVPKNAEEAFNLYQRASSYGDGDGLFKLGKAFADGQRVPKDLIEAYASYMRAAKTFSWEGRQMSDLGLAQFTSEYKAKQGAALKARDDIARQLAPAEIATAQKRVSQFDEPGVVSEPPSRRPN